MDSIQHVLSQDERWEAIQRAFAHFVDGAEIPRARRLWISKYADKPSFALSHFVSECCKLFELPNRRKDIIQITLRELMVQQHGGTAAAKPELAATVDDSGAHTALSVFQVVIRQLGLLAGDDAARGMRQYIIGNLDRVELDGSSRSELQSWLSGHQLQLVSAVRVSSMQLMINLAYISLCEFCGPVRADSILHEAIREAADCPEGKQFDPAKLL